MATNGDRYKKGSVPPFVGFAEVVSFAEKIYEHGGARASYDLLSQIFDNSTKSSSFTKKLAAMRWYGVVVEPSKGDVQLSETGLAIAAPQSPLASMNARKEAFLRIEPFSKVYERHKGKLLPADEFLKNIFEQDCGIPKDLSDSWVSSFKDAIRVAGLLYDRGDQKTQIMESAVVSRTVNVSSSLVSQPEAVGPIESVARTEAQPSVTAPISISGHNTKITLSGQRYALFSIPDSLTARDAQKIKSAITGLSAIIDSLVEDEKN